MIIAPLLRGIPPWIHTERGYRPNKNFTKIPVDGPVSYWNLAQLCMDKNPKNRPDFGTIKSLCKVKYQIPLMRTIRWPESSFL